MKVVKVCSALAGLLFTASIAQAAHLWQDPNAWWNYNQDAPRYSANELSLDLFGSYLNPEGEFNDLFSTNIRHGVWGGGAGLNYYLTREFGFGGNFNMSDNPGDRIVDYTIGNLYLRLPLGNTGIAPYIFGGGGRGFTPVYQWLYGGGVGLEYRFSPIMGVFSDAGFLWSDRATSFDMLTIRAGLKIVF